MEVTCNHNKQQLDYNSKADRIMTAIVKIKAVHSYVYIPFAFKTTDGGLVLCRESWLPGIGGIVFIIDARSGGPFGMDGGGKFLIWLTLGCEMWPGWRGGKELFIIGGAAYWAPAGVSAVPW